MHTLHMTTFDHTAWQRAILALILGIIAVIVGVVQSPGPAGVAEAAPPAYVSRASSLIGTADGALIGGSAATPASPARPALGTGDGP
jgi:hypothetical protein